MLRIYYTRAHTRAHADMYKSLRPSPAQYALSIDVIPSGRKTIIQLYYIRIRRHEHALTPSQYAQNCPCFC